MYENGRKVSRYYNKCKHKEKIKNNFASGWYDTDMKFPEFLDNLSEEQLEYRWGAVQHIPPCLQYWHTNYLTGPRQYAKDATNSIIRAHWRQKINNFYHLDEEDWVDFDSEMEQHNGYQKHYDYSNTLW